MGRLNEHVLWRLPCRTGKGEEGFGIFFLNNSLGAYVRSFRASCGPSHVQTRTGGSPVSAAIEIPSPPLPRQSELSGRHSPEHLGSRPHHHRPRGSHPRFSRGPSLLALCGSELQAASKKNGANHVNASEILFQHQLWGGGRQFIHKLSLRSCILRQNIGVVHGTVGRMHWVKQLQLKTLEREPKL